MSYNPNTRNAKTSVAQVVTTGVLTFILYKILLNKLGVEMLGVWSVLLGTLSSIQLVNMGFGGSIVRYVAKYDAEGDHFSVNRLTQTALISVFLFMGILLVLAWPFHKILLQSALNMGEAKLNVIMPAFYLTLPGACLNVASMILHGTIDGFHRLDLRCKLQICVTIIYFLSCIFLVDRLGLTGLALAYFGQQLLNYLGSLVILKSRFSIDLVPKYWDKALFQEMGAFTFKFQFVQILGALVDPITKILLSRFGGFAWSGYYEMANKLVLQLRAVIVSALTTFVPEFTKLYHKNQTDLKTTYLKVSASVNDLSLSLFSAIAISAPFVSLLWIGHLEPIFIFAIYMLSAGWLFSTIATPAFFAFVGIGRLKSLLIGTVITAIITAVGGVILGRFFGGHGPITSYALGTAIGGLVFLVSFCLDHDLALLEQITRKNLLTALLNASLVAFTYFAFKPEDISLTRVAILFAFLAGAFLGVNFSTIKALGAHLPFSAKPKV